jgi:hypothetical protein
MKTAHVTLYREGEPSPILNKTFCVQIRDYLSIQWTTNHVVFQLPNDMVVAYHAQLIHSITTTDYEE